MKAIGRAPAEHGLRDLSSPGDAALDARRARVLSAPSAVLALVAQRRERRRVAPVQRRLSGREQADQRRVGRSDDRCPARRAARGRVVNEHWRVTPFDAVVGIEDRRVDDRPEPLTGGVRRIRRNQRVDEDLIPLQHLVHGGGLRRLVRGFDGSGTDDAQRDEEGDPRSTLLLLRFMDVCPFA